MTKTVSANALTQQEIAKRIGVSPRTVKRYIRRWGLQPVYFIGQKPLFSYADVVTLEGYRHEARLIQLGYKPGSAPSKILTVRQAKRLAGRCK